MMVAITLVSTVEVMTIMLPAGVRNVDCAGYYDSCDTVNATRYVCASPGGAGLAYGYGALRLNKDGNTRMIRHGETELTLLTESEFRRGRSIKNTVTDSMVCQMNLR